MQPKQIFSSLDSIPIVHDIFSFAEKTIQMADVRRGEVLLAEIATTSPLRLADPDLAVGQYFDLSIVRAMHYFHRREETNGFDTRNSPHAHASRGPCIGVSTV